MEEKLWNPSSSGRSLRAPKTNIDEVTTKCDHKSEESAVPVIPPEKSKLNVSASEFVPRCFSDNSEPVELNMSKSAIFSVQQRLKVHKESDNQRNHDNSINAQFFSQGDSNLRYANNSIDDRRLKQLINTLTNDPGQFDNLLDIFKQTLRPYFDDINALPGLMNMLVGQAIDQPSFRYTAARLCYSIEQESPIFRAELHLTCNRELSSNPNKQGIVLFVAELYTQLHHENIYGKCLTTAFKDLLQDGGDSNIKCVCQALKLTGHSLEQYDKEALDEVMALLMRCKKNVAGTALCLLESVVNLRNSKWGYAASESSGSEEGGYWEEEETNNISTIFYNPDGNMLSTEETEFLAANLQSTDEYLIDGSDPDELCDPEPEMDEEIQAAFKEFVKLSKR